MKHTIKIHCLNNGTDYEVPLGSTLDEVFRLTGVSIEGGVTSARVNNKMEGLDFVLLCNKDVEFVGLCSPSGRRTYTRSLFFVLYRAVTRLYHTARLRIDTPVSGGYYCRIDLGHPLELDEVAAIKEEMQRIVAENLPFERVSCRTEEAVALFRREGLDMKARLLKSVGKLYTTYYTLDGLADYYYGSLLLRTGQIRLFDLVKYYDGVLLRIPDATTPSRLADISRQDKMFAVFQEHHRWQEILGVSTIGDLNVAAEKGMTNALINVSEALQEKKISRMADDIAARRDVRVVLISGPSSSGKTTFSKRLSVQLMASGRRPMPISLDDYFVDRELTPLDENGEYDYESINALNIELIEEHLNALIRGDEVELPRFNFQTGRSEKSGKKLRLKEDDILVLEGIHALNPTLTEQVPDRHKFKIYASALTSILLDDHNYIPTTDNRLLRRIVRDYKYRGYSARDTIRRWPSVRRGEDKWIFPYQENADAMFNSALLFELAVLRNQALPLLQQVDERDPEYCEAVRLTKFLLYLRPMSIEGLPPTSLLREFLGGSTFSY